MVTGNTEWPVRIGHRYRSLCRCRPLVGRVVRTGLIGALRWKDDDLFVTKSAADDVERMFLFCFVFRLLPYVVSLCILRRALASLAWHGLGTFLTPRVGRCGQNNIVEVRSEATGTGSSTFRPAFGESSISSSSSSNGGETN